jgi:hypothetical protein
MTRGFFLSILFIGLISSVFEVKASTLEESASLRRWQLLGHYKERIGGHISESRPGPFFLSPTGHRDPVAELGATIEALAEDHEGPADQHARCRFPARTLFAIEQGLLPNATQVTCPAFNDFKNKLGAKGISLIFSSYFLDTPASAFGHTLLRFSKNPSERAHERFELLDYAANYAANVTTGNALLYAVLGMAGGFWGEYAVMPYFYKVREYNDFESRDLWDYNLNLTEEQIDWVVAHLWELSQARFPYLYLSRNCSYHILALLDVANPEWYLADRLKSYVIPVDTIRVLSETPGIVRDISFRPSKRRVLERQLAGLTREEQALLRRALRTQSPEILLDDSLPPERIARRLDVALDSIDFLNASEVVREDPEVLSWKRQFLLARSRLGLQTSPPEIPMPHKERPDTGHRSTRFTPSYQFNPVEGPSYTFEYRFALHDFLDPLLGHNPGSSMEMGRMALRYLPKDRSRGETSRLEVEDFTLVEVRSLSPLTPFFRKLSWRAQFGGTTLRSTEYRGLFAPQGQLAAGPAFSIFQNKLLLAPFIFARADYHSRFNSTGLRLATGPELTLIARISRQLNLMASYQWERHLISNSVSQDSLLSIQSKFAIQTNLAIHLGWTQNKSFDEFKLGLSFYH